LEVNPGIRIITNVSVKKLLNEWNVVSELIKDGSEMEVEGITLKAFEAPHANIYPSLLNVLTTSFSFLTNSSFLGMPS
jgi:hypothetical protein